MSEFAELRWFSRGSPGAVPSPARPGQFLRFPCRHSLAGLGNRDLWDLCLSHTLSLCRGERCWLWGVQALLPPVVPSIRSVFLPVSLPSLGSHEPSDTRGEEAGLSLQVRTGSNLKSQFFRLICEWGEGSWIYPPRVSLVELSDFSSLYKPGHLWFPKAGAQQHFGTT